MTSMQHADPIRPDGGVEGQSLISSLAELCHLVGRGADVKTRRWIIVLTATIAAVIINNTFLQTKLNNWQGGFYDSIEGRNVDEFLRQIWRYLELAGGLLILVVAQTWAVEKLKIALRRIITETLLDSWLVPRRTYLLAFAGAAGANPDQRIHDDTRRLAELSAELGASLFQSGLMLATFVSVLWMLSDRVGFQVGGDVVTFPGSMVWCAVAFSLSGSLLTWWFGQPLIDRNARRYEREAELRLALVRVNEAAEGVTLYGGEADERRIVDRQLESVLDAMTALATRLVRLTWVTSGYGWLALVVPILAASPGYFTGTLSLGGLMMVVNSFNQVQASLRWFVDNFQRIADWQAALLRVRAIETALDGLASANGGHGHVKHEVGGDRLVVEDLTVALTGGPAELDAPLLEVGPGEHVLMIGAPQAGKTMVFLTMAGLWTRGGGTIRMPAREQCMFMPERPYLPPRSLRAALSYPEPPDMIADEAAIEALTVAGVAHLADELDREERWDRVLAIDEQQSLAFTRLLLHRPRFVFMDDAASALDPLRARALLAAVRRLLPQTAVVGTSRNPDPLGFYERIVHVRRRAAAPTVGAPAAGTPSRPPAATTAPGSHG